MYCNPEPGDGRARSDIKGRFGVNEASFDATGHVKPDPSFEQR